MAAKREGEVSILLVYRHGRAWKVFETDTHTKAKAVLDIVGRDREYYIAQVIETGPMETPKSFLKNPLGR